MHAVCESSGATVITTISSEARAKTLKELIADHIPLRGKEDVDSVIEVSGPPLLAIFKVKVPICRPNWSSG
jgi:hypothetical protein